MNSCLSGGRGRREKTTGSFCWSCHADQLCRQADQYIQPDASMQFDMHTVQKKRSTGITRWERIYICDQGIMYLCSCFLTKLFLLFYLPSMRPHLSGSSI